MKNKEYKNFIIFLLFAGIFLATFYSCATTPTISDIKNNFEYFNLQRVTLNVYVYRYITIEYKTLYLYKISDGIDYIYFLSSNLYDEKDYEISGKIYLLDVNDDLKKSDENKTVYILYKDLKNYLYEKNLLPGQKSRSSELLVFKILKSILNELTNERFSEFFDFLDSSLEDYLKNSDPATYFVIRCIYKIYSYIPERDKFILILDSF